MTHLLQTLLAESARKKPDKIAAKLRDKNISYAQLDLLSGKLAHCLIKNGVSAGDRIGIYLDKSIEGLISVFGILKAGACYVPLDPVSPAKKQRYIIHDCGIRYLITSSGKFLRIKEIMQERNPIKYIINLDETKSANSIFPTQIKVILRQEVLKSNILNRKANIHPRDLAYILYTSGSTGRPKGVMISHRASLAFVDWAHGCFNVSAEDRVAGFAPFYFDLSIFDIFVTFKAGATLHLLPQGVSAFPKSLAQFLEKERITIWYSVPHPLIQLVLYGDLKKRDFSCLRQVLYAGDVFPVKYLRKLVSLIPHAKFYNLYGPTETNVCAYYPLKGIKSKDKTVPIGKACSGAKLFALDEEKKPINPGHVGELYVSGPSLMGGYWNDEAKLNKNGKLYRTGDLVGINGQGNYIFIGRKDSMIKSRGYRIELGEVEAALYEHPEIKEVSVFAVQDKIIGKKIKAAVVLKKSGSVSEGELAHFCGLRLPRYCIPEIFEFRDFLPRTTTGKVNRMLLKERERLE